VNKLLISIVAVLVLASAGFLGYSIHTQKQQEKVLQQQHAMEAIRDSLAKMDLEIRTAQDPKLRQMAKEKQKYFWIKLKQARESIQQNTSVFASLQGDEASKSHSDSGAVANANTTVPNELDSLLSKLSRVMLITAAILIFVILSVVLLLRKKKKLTLTQKIQALHEKEENGRFPKPKGGYGQSASNLQPLTNSNGQLPINPLLKAQAQAIFDKATREQQAYAPTEDLTAPQGIKGTAKGSRTRIMSPNRMDTPADIPNTPPTPNLQKITPQASPQAAPKPKTTRAAADRVTQALEVVQEAFQTLQDTDVPLPQKSSGKPKATVKSPNAIDPTGAIPLTSELPFTDPKPTGSILKPTRFDQEDEQKTEILKLARRGFTSSEIARRLKVPQDQVELIIRLQRD
jgi:hypothetical protein